MTTNSTPEPTNDRDAQPVNHHEFRLSNSTKLLENLFNSGKLVDHQANQSTKLQQLPEEIIQNLNHNLSEEEILVTAVEEARRVIDCDRVIIYNPPESSQGKVIAEAVMPGWTPALDITIKDPYLAPQYLKNYQQGYFRAVYDITQTDITKPKLEPLEKLQIKAMLIVPIWQQSKLFGLLVAHQCSETRQWQPEEIKYLEQITTLVRLALERAQLIREKEHWQQQAESEAQWTQFFNEATPYIYKCFQEHDILKATVREVRRLLSCDRVVVYSLNHDNHGEVIAESVAPGLTKTLGRTIEDPCFEARYIEKYQYGRVNAINNVYEAQLAECYLEQLEALEVKANLVTPILIENKIFGLLVAHHCFEPHQWKQYEIRWLTQVALQVGFALNHGKLLAGSIEHQQKQNSKTKWIQLLEELISYLRNSSHQSDLLAKTAKEARRMLNCDRVVVYSLNQDQYGEITAESVAPGFTKVLGKVIKDPCFEIKYLEKYQQGRVQAINNIQEAVIAKCYLEQLEKLEVKANLVTPIILEGKIFGLLVAHHCNAPHYWEIEEIDFLSQLAHHVGLELERTTVIAERDFLRKQVQTEAEWTEFFTQTVQYIHQSLSRKELLEITVEEVRRVLDCDRVVVYSLNPDQYGEVIAESVALGWTKALGRVIKDLCFEARYLEKYQNGRVRAIDNIYEARLTDCYIEQLEQLEVKANLITPIIYGGKIWGLLVAHQCSNPRKWQQYEIRWATQISTQVGFALDNAQLLQQLGQSSKTADYLIHQHKEQKEAFKQQLIAILCNSTNTYENLTEDALNQSESLLDLLHNIAKINDIVKNQESAINQTQNRKRQYDAKLQVIKKSIDLSLNGISSLQDSVQDATAKMNYVRESSQKIVAIVRLIQNLAKQIAQQSLNITIALGEHQNSNQESTIELADTLLSHVQQLYKAIAKINPLLSGIDTEACQGKIAIDSALDKAVTGTKLIQDTQRNIEQIRTINGNISLLFAKFAQDSQNQTIISQSTGESVHKVVNLANQISEHSSAITESFQQIVSLTQEL